MANLKINWSISSKSGTAVVDLYDDELEGLNAEQVEAYLLEVFEEDDFFLFPKVDSWILESDED